MELTIKCSRCGRHLGKWIISKPPKELGVEVNPCMGCAFTEGQDWINAEPKPAAEKTLFGDMT